LAVYQSGRHRCGDSPAGDRPALHEALHVEYRHGLRAAALAYSEVTDAAYFMFDFEQKLPWDMLVNGNLGARYVTTKVDATGFMTLAHTSVTAAYNPVTNPGGVITTTAALNTSIADDTSIGCPPAISISGSRLRWCFVYYQGEVMSRPPPGALLPSGQCTVDERNLAEVNGTADNPNTCTGRVGNPACYRSRPSTATFARVVSHSGFDVRGRALSQQDRYWRAHQRQHARREPVRRK
jgi:hypothetical protein